MATAAVTLPKTKGCAFLIEERTPQEVFTPEDLTEEHRAIGRAADEFWNKEVVPNLDEIIHGNHDLAVAALKKSAELGLTAILTPERYGGMELDLASSMIAAEHLARDGSYAAWHGAHSGIGTTPILLFGTEEQKQKYLPKLSSAEMIGAYCLSEPQAGSDAMAVKTRADLSPDGRHYILNGQKTSITNGGKADLGIRHDPQQAGGDGDPDIRRRVGQLSRRRPNRGAARRFHLVAGGCAAGDDEGRRGVRGRMFDRQSVRLGDARLRGRRRRA